MEFDVAEQLERIVETMAAHPVAASFAGLFTLLLNCLRKDGLFPKYLGYLEEKARLEAAKENRRLEVIKMLEERAQMTLPGVVKEEDRNQ